MSTDTLTAADVPSDDPMDATPTELKGEKPEHDSGSGRFKPKGGADTGGKKGKPAPSAPKKKTAPTSTPKLPPKVKQAPSEAPPSKPGGASPVPALASVPAAPPPGTTPPREPASTGDPPVPDVLPWCLPRAVGLPDACTRSDSGCDDVHRRSPGFSPVTRGGARRPLASTVRPRARPTTLKPRNSPPTKAASLFASLRCRV